MIGTRQPSPRQRELVHLNQTQQFKSNAPKTSIFMHEEKRIRQLHGPKPDLKYQIKLNDVILDKGEQRSRSTNLGGGGSGGGRLILGSNFNEEQPIVPDNRKVRNKDLFGIQK